MSGASRKSIATELVRACRDAGTTHVFGVPGGGSNLDVVGAAIEQGMQFVLVHTETAAAIMAGVVGELTAAPGVCVATRGPGAASVVNGVAQALLDRQPLIAVTDCVAETDQARISHQRLDQQALMSPITKASVVLDGTQPHDAIAAVALSLQGPPGPVHIDIDPGRPTPVRAPHTPAIVNSAPDELDAVRELVAAAARPVIIAGVGVVAQSLAARHATVAAINELASATNTPVLCTYKARGVTPDSQPWTAGVATGATIESPLLHEADLIIGIGLDPVELIPATWPYAAPVVLLGGWQVDDSTFFEHHLHREVVGALPELIAHIAPHLHTTWSHAAGAHYRVQAERELRAAIPASANGLTPQQVVDLAAAAAPTGTIATVDAGAHMLVAMPLWPTEQPGELLISSGLATMGFALPAAIAAALARPDRRVVCFTGDGGIGMALTELETAARLKVNLTIVVFNDNTLSLIAAKQQPEGHGGAEAVTYLPTDFAAIARGCGMRAERVGDVSSYANAVRAALAADGPTLLDVAVDPSAYGDVLDAIRGARAVTAPASAG